MMDLKDCCTISPGRTVHAGIPRDGIPCLVDSDTREVIARYKGHRGVVYRMAFAPNGERIVTASSDGTARIWNTITGEELFRMQHGCSVNDAFFSQDGRWVATTSQGTVRFFDAANGSERLRIDGHIGSRFSPPFAPDGKRVLVVCDDGKARILDLATGTESIVIDSVQGPIRSAAFSPSGRSIVIALENETGYLVDGHTGERLRKLEGGGISLPQFQDDGHVSQWTRDDIQRVWEVATGRELNNLTPFANRITFAEFTPDGQRVIATFRDGWVVIWDVATGEARARLGGHHLQITNMTFTPDGRRLLTASQDGTARLWDIETQTELFRLESRDASIDSALLSPDGARIATTSTDGWIEVWDGETGERLLAIDRRSRSGSPAFSLDGSRLAVLVEDDATGNETASGCWNALTGAEIAEPANPTEFPHPSPNERMLGYRYWTRIPESEQANFGGTEQHLMQVCRSPNAARILISTRGQTSLWDAGSGTRITTTDEGVGNTNPFAPDGSHFLIANFDDTIHVFDSFTGELQRVLHTYGEPTECDCDDYTDD